MRALCAAGLALLMGTSPAATLLACGNKFLVASRGTRFQQAPAVRKSAAILIYSNPESEAANALASVPIDAMLRSVGHRPTTVETTAEFEKQLSQGGWDLVLVSLADAEVARERVQGSAGLLPVVVKATTAEMKQAKQQFSVVLSAPTKSRTFLAVVDEALAHRSKNRAKTAKPAI